MAEPSRWQRYVDAAVNDPQTGGESRTGSTEAAGRGAVSRQPAPGSRQFAPGRAGPAGNGREFRRRLRGQLRDRLRARLVPDPAVPARSEDRRRTDLRLAPPALLVWGTAVAGSWLAPAALLVLCVILGVSAGLLLHGLSARPRRRRGGRKARRRSCRPGTVRSSGGRPPPTRSFLTTLALALLLSTAAGAHSAVAASLRHEGALAEAVTAHAAVVMELEIAGTPRQLRVPGRSGLADRWAVPATLLVMYAEGRRVQAEAGLLVMGGADWEHLVPGQRLRTTGKLKPPEPGQGGAGILSASSAPETLRAPDGWQQGPGMLRRSFTAAAAGLGGDARGLLPGMVTGDTGALDAGLEAAMRTVGMTHLTAVSGANCSLILGALLLAARSLRFPRPAAAAVSLAGLGMFVLMVGPDASVLRAAVMGAIGVSSLAFGRAGRGLSFLCLAVIGLLLLDPALSVSFGFLLSVLATLGIVVAGRRIMEWLPASVPRWAAAGLAVPLSAQAFCGPVIVLLQPQFSAYALPANLAAAVLVPPVTLLGTAAVPLVPLVPATAAALMAAAGACAGGVAGLARFFAALPGAALPWPEGTFGLSTMALFSVVCLAALRLALQPAAAVRLAVAAHSRTVALLDPTRGATPGRRGPRGGRRRGLVDRSRRGTLRVCKPTSRRNRQWLLPRPNAPGRRRRTRPPGVT
jgi:competence protein ComEC